MNDAAVDVRGLVKRYEAGRVTALAGVDLRIERGEFVAICGPSGCGKTTLLNVLAAVERPDEGGVRVCGRDLTALSPAAADDFRSTSVGFVFQLHNLLPHLTALENVQVPLLGRNPPPADRGERAAALLRRVGLADRMHATPPTLSGGERQRVAICRALVGRPGLLLADEPTGALDSRTGDHLLELLEELRAEQETTLVVVTHDARLAARAKRTIHMLDGAVVS
jgi:ABC-type lipoprotein export system ATPase subunit